MANIQIRVVPGPWKMKFEYVNSIVDFVASKKSYLTPGKMMSVPHLLAAYLGYT